MKLLIAILFLGVVSALPARHEYYHPVHQDSQLDGPTLHQNGHQQIDLIKLVYQKLIDRLNHPSQDDNEEEESAINDIVDTINEIGHILHDDSDNGDDNNGFNGPPKPQQPEHSEQGDVPNKPPSSNNEIQEEEEILPSHVDIEDDVISDDEELPAGDESDEVSLVDSILEEDDNEHVVLSLVKQKDDDENPLLAYNSISVVNEAPAL